MIFTHLYCIDFIPRHPAQKNLFILDLIQKKIFFRGASPIKTDSFSKDLSLSVKYKYISQCKWTIAAANEVLVIESAIRTISFVSCLKFEKWVVLKKGDFTKPHFVV